MAHFTPEEKKFFDDYSLSELIDEESSYFHSRKMLGVQSDVDEYEDTPLIIPEELQRDFTKCKVVELKEECRERGLSVTGTKAVLIERIQADVEQQISELQRQHEATRMRRPQISGRINGDMRSRPPSFRPFEPVEGVPPETDKYLEGLVKEYIQASGGQAGSRDIGRYLAINADSSGQRGTPEQGKTTALTELKGLYGGLNAFILNHGESFEKFDDDSRDTTSFEFQVSLRDKD